jgi:23S rRNA (pseudouridine1915-N3)-methyltransferase
MKITVLGVGATDKAYVTDGSKVFIDRLKHYVKFDFVELIVPKKFNSLPVIERKSKEGEMILKQLEPGDFLMLLDEKGKEFTSRQFSEFLEKQTVNGCKRLVLVIGGAFGFSDEVYAQANGKLSLSKMTFSHQMIRMFVFEQIYRAFTILKNEPYHND